MIHKNRYGKFHMKTCSPRVNSNEAMGKEFNTLDSLVEHYKQYGLVDEEKNLINFRVPGRLFKINYIVKCVYKDCV